jgi:hypothetical protein
VRAVGTPPGDSLGAAGGNLLQVEPHRRLVSHVGKKGQLVHTWEEGVN